MSQQSLADLAVETADECRQCASMLHDMKPAAAPAAAGMVAQDGKDAARWKMFIEILVDSGNASDAAHAEKLLDEVIAGKTAAQSVITLATQQAQASAKEGDQA